MTKEGEEVDVWKEKVQQDMNSIQQDVKNIKSDVSNLQLKDVKQDQQIETMQSTLSTIQADTTWTRRAITGAFITAIVGTSVGLAIANLF